MARLRRWAEKISKQNIIVGDNGHYAPSFSTLSIVAWAKLERDGAKVIGHGSDFMGRCGLVPLMYGTEQARQDRRRTVRPQHA